MACEFDKACFKYEHINCLTKTTDSLDYFLLKNRYINNIIEFQIQVLERLSREDDELDLPID